MGLITIGTKQWFFCDPNSEGNCHARRPGGGMAPGFCALREIPAYPWPQNQFERDQYTLIDVGQTVYQGLHGTI